jgi:hypothetical protein
MGVTHFVLCLAGQWTRIYQNPSPFGFVYLWAHPNPVHITYRQYSAGIPPCWHAEMDVGEQSTLIVGPTPYIGIWVNPDFRVQMRAT